MLGRCHLITDTRFGRDPLPVVAAALDAGVDVVQVRVKDGSDAAALRLVEATLELCAPYGAACIVDDRLDVALASGAAGVHLGAEDLPVDRARAIAGPDLLIGATVRDAAGAGAAVAAGASYLGAGPAYATATKDGLPPPIGVEGIRAVCAAVGIPVIAIGGVTAERIAPLLAAGAHGVAVIGAIYDAPDPAAAAHRVVRALAGANGAQGAGAGAGGDGVQGALAGGGGAEGAEGGRVA